MKKLPLLLLLGLLFSGCKFHLIPWRTLEIKYQIRGTAEGFAVERLKDHGWVWEMESKILKGYYKNMPPGRLVIHIDYWNKTGYRILNNSKFKIPGKVFDKINWWRAWKSADFDGVVRIYLNQGYRNMGEKEFLGRKCLVLVRKKSGNLSEVYLWKKLPFNMPLYRLEKSGGNFFEKKAIEIKEEK